MYTAGKGKGAFCNGVPIKVSGQEGQSVCKVKMDRKAVVKMSERGWLNMTRFQG